MPISLSPKDALTGSLPIGDMEVLDARFEIYTYDGKVQFDSAPPTCLRLDLRVLADGSEHTEMLSAGSSDNTVPSEDGLTLEAQHDGVTGVYANTKLMMFIKTLADKGFPDSALKAFTASCLIGLQFTAERPAAPDSDMPSKSNRTDGKERKDRPKTFFAVKEIIKLPSDSKKSAAAKSGKATSAAKPVTRPAASAASRATMGQKPEPEPATDSPDSSEINERVQALVMEILESSNGTTPVNALKVKIFGKVKGEPADIRTEIIKLATSVDWLSENGFTVDAGTVSM
jgi:hypothetical protein